jgi:hypothetical protein
VVGLGAFNLFENVIGLGGPDKRLALTIMFFDICEDTFLESFEAAKGAAAELILGQIRARSTTRGGVLRAHRPLALLLAPWSELLGVRFASPVFSYFVKTQ